jgi:ribonuclease-3 family protein
LVFGADQRMTQAQAMRLNPKQWAFVGDTVYDLFLRTYVMTHTDYTLPKMHKLCVAHVSCRAQAQVLERIGALLTSQEEDIVRRSRKVRTHTTHKNADPADYAKATALEALFGFLYLTGQDARMEALMAVILKEE